MFDSQWQKHIGPSKGPAPHEDQSIREAASCLVSGTTGFQLIYMPVTEVANNSTLNGIYALIDLTLLCLSISENDIIGNGPCSYDKPSEVVLIKWLKEQFKGGQIQSLQEVCTSRIHGHWLGDPYVVNVAVICKCKQVDSARAKLNFKFATVSCDTCFELIHEQCLQVPKSLHRTKYTHPFLYCSEELSRVSLRGPASCLEDEMDAKFVISVSITYGYQFSAHFINHMVLVSLGKSVHKDCDWNNIPSMSPNLAGNSLMPQPSQENWRMERQEAVLYTRSLGK